MVFKVFLVICRLTWGCHIVYILSTSNSFCLENTRTLVNVKDKGLIINAIIVLANVGGVTFMLCHVVLAENM